MRPLKLVMTAFGPYAQREEIDFSEIGEENVFLITGQTGAGKTTIFDGISYAIYGEASGDERSTESLRSDFASLDYLTCVELDFKLKGVHYYIKRTPKQERRKSRGEGTTEQKADAELTIYGENLKEEKVYSGIMDVNEKIEEVMGINSEQFKQIMMIPQGDFRKLLTADSREREKIFRKIFGTAGYKKVEQKLVEKADEVKREIMQLNNSFQGNLQRIDTKDNEKLKELLDEENRNNDLLLKELEQQVMKDEELNKSLEKDIGQKQILLVEKHKERVLAVENNGKFASKDKLELEKKKLEGLKDQFKEKQKKVEGAQKALKIKISEDNSLEKEANYQKRLNEYKEMQVSLEKAEEEVKITSENLKKEEDKKPEREKLSSSLNTLEGYKQKVAALADKQAKLDALQASVKSKEEKIKENNKIITDLKEKAKELNKEIEKARKADTQYLSNQIQLQEVNQLEDKLQKLTTANSKLLSLREKYLALKKEYKKVQEDYNQQKERYDKNQDKWLKAQAGVLAQGLAAGVDCPVCGSKDHPSPAKLANDFPAEEDLKLEKEKLSISEKHLKDKFEKVSDISSAGTSQAEVVNGLLAEVQELIPQQINSLAGAELNTVVEEKLVQTKEKKDKLEARKKNLERTKGLLEPLEKKLKKHEEELEAADKRANELNRSHLEASNTFEAENASLRLIKEEIPLEIQTPEALEKKYQQVEQEHTLMLKKLEDQQAKKQNSLIRLEQCKTQKQAGKEMLEETGKAAKEAKEKFLEDLSLAGFSLEEYKLIKLTEEEISALEEEIQKFKADLQLVTSQYEEKIKELAGLEIMDISKLEQDYQEINDKLEVLLEERKHLFARIKNNKESLKICLDILAEKSVQDERYSVLGDLAETSKGNNHARLNFERYVLAAFFEEIIGTASIRLLKMTENRYKLNRRDERAKYNAQSGLELEVFDNYTGYARHVKTLSGGEGFKASLALALGLADVVQAHSGGISLDTIFVDEGFGTLDADSLENAIETLLDLQKSGRMVGIISHVPELKERIKVKLEVISSPQGSKTQFKI